MNRFHTQMTFTRSTVSLSFAIFLIGTALAGCVGTQDTSSDPVGLEEPWPVGSWWTYRINGSLPADWMDIGFGDDTEGFGHEPKFSIESEATLVATMDREAGDDPRFLPHRAREILSDDQEVSFLQRYGLPLADLWTVNTDEIRPRNGTNFFEMPLEDGKKWTTEFMGASLQIEVDLSEDGIVLEGIGHDGLPLLRYTYDPDSSWFGEFRILNTDGSESLTAILAEHGLDYDGSLYWLQQSRVTHCRGGNGLVGPGFCSISLEVSGDGHYSWWIDIAYKSEGPGKVAATKSTPHDELAVWFENTCPCEDKWSLTEEAEGTGDYEWTINRAFTGEWFLSFLHVDRCFVKVEAAGGWTDQHPAHTGQCTTNQS